MPTNNFLTFATGSGSSSNLASQASYAASSERDVGFVSGLCPRIYYNKALRQANFMTAALGEWLKSKGYDALDNGNLTTLTNTMVSAWTVPAPTVTPDNVVTFGNKTIDGANNTILNISLTASVAGILPFANGGTNRSTIIGNGKILGATGGAYVERDPFNVNSSLNLTGGSSGTETPLVVGVNEANVSGGTNYYILPSGVSAGSMVIILNRIGGSVYTYPPSGGTIEGSSSGDELINGSAWYFSKGSNAWLRVDG